MAEPLYTRNCSRKGSKAVQHSTRDARNKKLSCSRCNNQKETFPSPTQQQSAWDRQLRPQLFLH